MKVAFLENVPNVADAGEVKEVADGYARNYLIPKKLAVLADSKAANVVEAQLKKRARQQAQTETEMKELAKQLEGLEIVLQAKAGAKDRLYGSITNADVAEEIEKSAGIVVDKRKIELDEPIREVGSYEIAIKLTGDIVPKVKLTVMGEEKAEVAEKKAEGKEKKRKKAAKAEKKETKVEEEEKKGEQEETKAEPEETE